MKYIKTIILTAAALLSAASTTASALPSDALHQSPVAQVTVTVQAGGVEIANPAEHEANVSVYAITGQLVKQCTATPGGVTMIELAAGCYIVRVDGLSRRVVIL